MGKVYKSAVCNFYLSIIITLFKRQNCTLWYVIIFVSNDVKLTFCTNAYPKSKVTEDSFKENEFV